MQRIGQGLLAHRATNIPKGEQWERGSMPDYVNCPALIEEWESALFGRFTCWLFLRSLGIVRRLAGFGDRLAL